MSSQPSSPSSPSVAVSHGRMAFLDVIRGIAALAVVIEHASERLFPGYLAAANSHFTFGVFGIATFFIVSGFIIPVSMERHNSLAEFWKARFFRLYPMYWFSLAVGVALTLFTARSVMAIGAHSWVVIMANTTMLQQFMGLPNVSGLYWTLTMEMLFYFLCTALFLLALLSSSLRLAWTAATLNLICAMVLGVFFHRSFPAGRTALIVSAFFGTVLYRYNRGILPIKPILKLAPFVALSLVTGFWFRFFLYNGSNDPRRFQFLGVTMSYVGAYSLFLFLFAIRGRRMPSFLVWLGRISYSLYLIHGLAIMLVPGGSFPYLRLLAIIILAVAISSLTYQFIERPGLAMYKKWSSARSEQPLKNVSEAALSGSALLR